MSLNLVSYTLTGSLWEGIITPHRSTTCDRPSSVVSVCRSVTLVSPAKTAEPIEMPFGLRTRVAPGNHVLDGGPDLPWEGAILGERGGSKVSL